MIPLPPGTYTVQYTLQHGSQPGQAAKPFTEPPGETVLLDLISQIK